MSNFVWVNRDCRHELAELPADYADLVLTDPPYPNVKRDYGRMSVSEWNRMMDEVVEQCRRILKPAGSMVLVLQAGRKPDGTGHDPWLFYFMARWAAQWGMPQDLYWFNYTMLPCGPAMSGHFRPSVKNLVWLGTEECYRNQEEILWSESMDNAAQRAGKRVLGKASTPSGHARNRVDMAAAAERRGGVTPFNCLPIAGCRSSTGHGAETPEQLADLLIRYLCPPGGKVLDPFGGGGNIGAAALKCGRDYFGIEQHPDKFALGLEHLTRTAGHGPVKYGEEWLI